MVFLVLTNLISIGCLGWTLREARLSEFKDDLIAMQWWWVVLAVVADIAAYCWQGIRWQMLLHPVVEIPLRRVIRAIYVGLFTNEVLPFRAGEVVRCYLLTRWTALPFSVSLASGLVERVFDGLWLIASLFLAFQLVTLPHALRYLDDGAYALGSIVLVGAAVIGIALFQRRLARGLLAGEGWRRRAVILLDDLALMGHSKYLLLSFAHSLPYLLLQCVPVWASLRGYGFDLGFKEAFVLAIFLRLGTTVPSAPGNLGLYQLLAKECLEKLFNVPSDEAARFALVLWGIVTIPLLVGGSVALGVTGARIGELRRAAEQEARKNDGPQDEARNEARR